LNEQNGGELSELANEGNGSQEANHKGTGTELKGKAHEDDTSSHDADGAGPGSISDKRHFRSFEFVIVKCRLSLPH
jgi:hypothetical protein